MIEIKGHVDTGQLSCWECSIDIELSRSIVRSKSNIDVASEKILGSVEPPKLE
jgi:hypothetical protein